MRYSIKPSTQFKKDIKLAKKRGYDISLIMDIIDTLALGKRFLPRIVTMNCMENSRA